MITDFFGTEIHIGDECAFIEPYYHELNNGKVIKITQCGATVEFKSFKGHIKTTSRISSQIIVRK